MFLQPAGEIEKKNINETKEPQHYHQKHHETNTNDGGDTGKMKPQQQPHHNGSNSRRVKKFIVKYNYNPLMGPNENPEAEMSLKAGQFVYVNGSMDADGFYEGMSRILIDLLSILRSYYS